MLVDKDFDVSGWLAGTGWSWRCRPEHTVLLLFKLADLAVAATDLLLDVFELGVGAFAVQLLFDYKNLYLGEPSRTTMSKHAADHLLDVVHDGRVFVD